MSDFSLLYKKYNSVSNLTSGLNSSVIALKRRNLASRPEIVEANPKLNVTDDDVQKAQKEIAVILGALENFYSNQDTNNEMYELMDNALFRSQILNNTEFKIQIMHALEKIKNNADLNRKDLASIDKFISVLDNEAAVLFRKLRTNRG